jgi:hypothetical protein
MPPRLGSPRLRAAYRKRERLWWWLRITSPRCELRAGKLEHDAPELQKEVVACDAEVDRLISLILVPLAQQLMTRGQQITAQLAPIRNALATLWAEQSPTQFDAAEAFQQGRQPLAETKKAVAAFLGALNAVERTHPDPWIEVRKRLREDPHAELPDLCSCK